MTSASVVNLRTAPAALWAARSWRATAHALVGLPLGVVGFALTGGLPIGAAYCAGWSLLYAAPDAWPMTVMFLLLTVVSPLPALWSVRGLTALQRRRFRTLLGVDIPPLPRRGDQSPPRPGDTPPPRSDDPLPPRSRDPRPPRVGDLLPPRSRDPQPPRVGEALPPRVGEALPPRSRDPLPARVGEALPPRTGDVLLGRAVRTVRAASTWRQIAYHMLALFIGVAGGALTAAFWTVGIGLGLVVPMRLLGLSADEGWLPATAPAGVLAVAALLAAPWVARGVARTDTAVARALLGPSRNEQLTLRVESLARSRADVVAATDAERRRIERDLHDGAQQRLVSLAMNLGMARAGLADAPAPAREAIAAAHDEAVQALAELREFVRGLHPAVLDDRGLDAALSGIVARAPLPVRLTVAVPERCPPVVEAIAYFVVSEALTNIAKHASATRAEVTVDRTADRLRIVITDNGQGGATIGGRAGTTERNGTGNESDSTTSNRDGTTERNGTGNESDSTNRDRTTERNGTGSKSDSAINDRDGTTERNGTGGGSGSSIGGRAGGVGGGGGTGLRGLAQRAASVDGTFALHSPVGGPTTITVELPCAR
ncbi:histidine kinase [Actinoplanes xinjiangensis]|uniref:sensor histidine kinase n=1 Tax=Actinoplanes xinjiangensis TaxID=512350 RepID=UPI003F4D9B0F